MTNQAKNIPNISINLRRGDVFVGRHADTDGKVLRVEGAEGPWFLVRHRDSRKTNPVKILPTTLFSSWGAVSEEDGAALYPWDGDRSTLSVSSADAPPPKMRNPSKRAPGGTHRRIAPTTGDVSVLPGPMPATVAHEPLPLAINDISAAPLANTNMERVAHFGPDPLPTVAHGVVNLDSGKTVRLYKSQRDGSKWAVVRDLAEALNVSPSTMNKRAASLGDDRAVMADVRSSYKNRILPTWLARLDAARSWFHPDTDDDANREDVHEVSAAPTSEPARASAGNEADGDEADGDVPDGVAIVRVDGVSLVAPGTGEADHKIRDVDLARFIGVDTIRNFRARIKKYENSGDMNGLDWRTCAVQQSTGNGGVRIFEVKSAFLTMDQALFVVAKSDSPSANALTRHIISVFLKVQRQGGVVTVPTAAPSIDQMMATMAQIAARAASEAARETVGAMLAEFRKAQPVAAPVDEKVRQDAETLRRHRANAAKKAAVSKDVNAVRREVQDVLRPIIRRFFSERMVSADIRDTRESQRCLRPNEIMDHFNKFVEFNARRLTTEEQSAMATISEDPEYRHRIINGLFNEASNFITGEKEIVDEAGVRKLVSVRPWYPKVALAADPRQTKIPGTGG